MFGMQILFIRDLVSLLGIFVYKVLSFVYIYGGLPGINAHCEFKLSLDERMIKVSPSLYFLYYLIDAYQLHLALIKQRNKLKFYHFPVLVVV